MSVFADVRVDIAGKLTAAGVPNVTLDPRGQLPCVVVELPRVVGPVGIGGWSLEVPVHVCVPPPGDADAAAWLLDALEPVLVTYPGALADPQLVNHGDADVPAYVVTVTTTVPNPNC